MRCKSLLTVDVAEATRFALLRMMQASRPVHGNVAFLPVQSRCALHATTSTDAAKLKEAVEDGAVITNIIFALLSHVAIHIVVRNFLQEVNIIIGVELCHFTPRGRFRALRLVSVLHNAEAGLPQLT